jgi:CRP-like cAMP-binding protein
MTSALVRKLETFVDLNEAQRTKLDLLCSDVRPVEAKATSFPMGSGPNIFMSWSKAGAAHYKDLPGGSRQITALLLPGDFLDADVTILGRMDHSVSAITRCKVAYIKPDSFNALASEDNLLARAFWWSTLVDEATLRSWLVNLGRRDAYARIANLLCEIHARMTLIGLVREDRLDLPLTQDQIADATGLTAVHTNRTLQRLRADGLIGLGRRMLTVLDVPGLQRVAGFEPTFLHLVRRPG